MASPATRPSLSKRTIPLCLSGLEIQRDVDHDVVACVEMHAHSLVELRPPGRAEELVRWPHTFTGC